MAAYVVTFDTGDASGSRTVLITISGDDGTAVSAMDVPALQAKLQTELQAAIESAYKSTQKFDQVDAIEPKEAPPDDEDTLLVRFGNAPVSEKSAAPKHPRQAHRLRHGRNRDPRRMARPPPVSGDSRRRGERIQPARGKALRSARRISGASRETLPTGRLRWVYFFWCGMGKRRAQNRKKRERQARAAGRQARVWLRQRITEGMRPTAANLNAVVQAVSSLGLTARQPGHRVGGAIQSLAAAFHDQQTRAIRFDLAVTRLQVLAGNRSVDDRIEWLARQMDLEAVERAQEVVARGARLDRCPGFERLYQLDLRMWPDGLGASLILLNGEPIAELTSWELLPTGPEPNRNGDIFPAPPMRRVTGTIEATYDPLTREEIGEFMAELHRHEEPDGDGQ